MLAVAVVLELLTVEQEDQEVVEQVQDHQDQTIVYRVQLTLEVVEVQEQDLTELQQVAQES
jgi:hypothetical protein